MHDLKVEQKFHDSKVHLFIEDEGTAFFNIPPEQAIQKDVWLKELPRILGNVKDKRILDCGCGTGMISAVLSRKGAKVTSFDVSIGMLRTAKKRAEHWKLEIPFIQSAFEKLPFKEKSFDFVVGTMILHHTELRESIKELKRVLKPYGKALFLETQVRNPFLRFLVESPLYKIRALRHGSPEEKPLTPEAIKIIKSVFPEIKFHFFLFVFLQLIGSILTKPVRKTILERLILPLFIAPDNFIAKFFPTLRKYSYWGVIEIGNDNTQKLVDKSKYIH